MGRPFGRLLQNDGQFASGHPVQGVELHRADDPESREDARPLGAGSRSVPPGSGQVVAEVSRPEIARILSDVPVEQAGGGCVVGIRSGQDEPRPLESDFGATGLEFLRAIQFGECRFEQAAP